MRAALLLLLVSLLSPLTSRAQSAKRDTTAAVFVYLQAGDTIAFEAVRQDSSVLRGVIVSPSRPRVNWEHFLTDGVPGMLTLSIFPPDAPGEVIPLEEYDYLSLGDSIAVTASVDGRSRTQRLPSVKNAVPLLGRSMLHTAYLAWYAQKAHRDTLPVFVTASGRTVQVITQVRGDSISLVVDGLEIITTWRDGALIDVAVPSQSLRIERVLTLPPAH